MQGFNWNGLEPTNQNLSYNFENVYHICLKRTVDKEIVGDFYPDTFGPIKLAEKLFDNFL